jgi:hypothetical protein
MFACASMWAASYYTVHPDDPKAVYLTSQQFGIRGDGIADDTEAIQKAIDKVQETAGEGIVLIPEGRYKISKTIYVWPSIRLIGYGSHRPVFVLGRNSEDGLAQGSGRSIPGFHLLEAMESMPDVFVRFGGHRHAAGATLEAARVPEFRERLNAYAAARLGPEDFEPRIAVDAVVTLNEIDETAANGVFALAPFGFGNPQPLFAALDVEVAGAPVIFAEKHLRVPVRGNGRTLMLKAWNFAARAGEFQEGTHIDVAFTLEEDAYSAARGYPGWCAFMRQARPAAQAREATV